MSMTNALFGFSGRLPRIEYFGLTIIALILLFIAGFFAYLMLSPAAMDSAIYVLGALACWISAAVTAKRLQDFGMPGWNAIWIVAIQAAAGWTASTGPMATILGLASTGLGLWLLFMRGESGKNAYGPEPQ